MTAMMRNEIDRSYAFHEVGFWVKKRWENTWRETAEKLWRRILGNFAEEGNEPRHFTDFTHF